MPTGSNAWHDVRLRREAAKLFERGVGYKSVATSLSLPPSTVRKWHRLYVALGTEALYSMGARHNTYSWETKCAAAKAVACGGMTKSEAMARYGIASLRSLEVWTRAYREGGEEALRPRPKGRPRGSGGGPRELTREQELERQVQRLEAEVAYLIKSIALKAEKRSRAARGRSS